MRFIKCVINFKATPPQTYSPMEVFLNVDAILLIKGDSIYVKPDYEPSLSKSLYGNNRIQVSSIKASLTDIKKVTE